MKSNIELLFQMPLLSSRASSLKIDASPRNLETLLCNAARRKLLAELADSRGRGWRSCGEISSILDRSISRIGDLLGARCIDRVKCQSGIRKGNELSLMPAALSNAPVASRNVVAAINRNMERSKN